MTPNLTSCLLWPAEEMATYAKMVSKCQIFDYRVRNVNSKFIQGEHTKMDMLFGFCDVGNLFERGIAASNFGSQLLGYETK